MAKFKHDITFVVDENNPKRRTLFCHECGNAAFVILHTMMARQSKSMKARHMRLVARCLVCKKEKRIGSRG